MTGNLTGNWHLAQLNVARPVAPLDSAVMADFVRDLPLINGIADAAPGFVWRLRDEEGADATSLRPYGADTMVNMSVWESVEALRDFAYLGPHLEPLRRRREWFDYAGIEQHLVLWWIPARHPEAGGGAGAPGAAGAQGSGPGRVHSAPAVPAT
jgi:uncharacterized protein DUF3291